MTEIKPALSSASAALMEIEARHSTGVVPLRDIALVQGQGACVRDVEGREFLDLAAGHGVVNVGHAHPRVSAAIAEQAQRLISSSAAFPNDRRAELLQRLVSVLPKGMDRIFFCNSGTEAIEAAIKFARLSTGRPGVVALMRGFHGRTLGALSATWERRYRAPFEPLIPSVQHVPAGKIPALDQAVADTTACVLLEVVQGEGGVYPLSEAYLQAAAELCRDRGALLVVDEVQTGFGRTGRLFACEHARLTPDILCMGKAIAGGVPMGAVAIGPRVNGLGPGTHGSTFGGNPLACAAALATLDVIQSERLADRSTRLGAEVLARLQALKAPCVREVRGLGLMIGIELKTRARPFLKALEDRGVLALSAGPTVLRLLPPLVISDEELDQALCAIEEVLMAKPSPKRSSV